MSFPINIKYHPYPDLAITALKGAALGYLGAAAFTPYSPLVGLFFGGTYAVVKKVVNPIFDLIADAAKGSPEAKRFSRMASVISSAMISHLLFSAVGFPIEAAVTTSLVFCHLLMTVCMIRLLHLQVSFLSLPNRLFLTILYRLKKIFKQSDFS